MTITIADIYRYPVKGLSPERLARTALSPGQCLPHDRRFAIALPTTEFDPAHPRWLSKTHFIMLMRDEKLAQLHTRFDEGSGVLTVARGGNVLAQGSLAAPEGRRAIAQFYTDFLAGTVAGPLQIVEAPGHAFADARPKPDATTDKYISLINLASIGALETAMGAAIDKLRFRANLYFEGIPAWGEHDWLGREIALGGARLRIIATITRCKATEVNPATATRDLDIVGALQRHFGHNLMGIYGEVIAGGDIAGGDALLPGA